MKIYQLHEYCGIYEDFTDTIIGSFLRKERAEEELIKAEAKEKELREKSEKCRNCLYAEEDFIDINSLLIVFPDYCSELEIGHSDYGDYCDNWYQKWDDSTFKIIEVEVEE